MAITGEVTAARALIKHHHPDVIFLDIELEDGTGFDMMEGFSSLDFFTIYITSYDQYSIQAIKHAAFDYILKPFSIIELRQSIERLREQMPLRKMLQALNTAKELKALPSFQEKLVLRYDKGAKVVHHDEILFFAADKPYSCIYLSDQSKVLLRIPLSKVKEQLPAIFFQVHRSYIINLSKVREWEKGRGGEVLLENGKRLPIAYRLKKEFEATIAELNLGKFYSWWIVE